MSAWENSEKITLSEYGSGWGWEGSTYAHAFDSETEYILSEYPLMTTFAQMRYIDNGTTLSDCRNESEITNGNTLFSGSSMIRQVSCKPNTGNAGNYYSWPAATAGGYHVTKGYNELSSVCPRGWKMSDTTSENKKSYQNLAVYFYNMPSNSDLNIRLLPTSFIRSGDYLDGRGIYGAYWLPSSYTSNSAYNMFFTASYLNTQNNYDKIIERKIHGYKYSGYSVRCVNR